eukprot:1122046-Pleurochrysis_carterae.AAC.7
MMLQSKPSPLCRTTPKKGRSRLRISCKISRLVLFASLALLRRRYTRRVLRFNARLHSARACADLRIGLAWAGVSAYTAWATRAGAALALLYSCPLVSSTLETGNHRGAAAMANHLRQY